jgi:hypothetical protein
LKERSIVICSIIMLALIAVGCTGYQASRADSTALGVIADRQNYTPMMSSTVGIGLTPVFTADNSTVVFNWHTDYGYFISWGSPGFKVNGRGPDVTTNDGKIYWSYSPDDMGKEKPPAHVTLSMIDKASGKTLNTTGLDIVWETSDVASVKR